MKHSALFAIVFLAAHTASAVTCGGFSIVPADHVLVKYSAPVGAGATRSTPVVSLFGTAISVARTLSGGSITDVTCVDDTVDLGSLGEGRFNLTWSDNVNFTSLRSNFTFYVGAPGTGNGGRLIDVLPPTLPDQPVRLAELTCSRNPAIAYVTGNDIHVSTYGSGMPCALSVVNLGILAPGPYNVDWSRSSGAVHSFRFVVQQPAPTSACSGVFSVTRTAGGTARLHFEDPYRGYTPTFSPPAVTGVYDTDPLDWPFSMTIVQPVADTADSQASGAPPSSTICHAEELDLGPLADGYYMFSWRDKISVNGVDSGFGFPSPLSSFYWRNGRVQCTSLPQLQTPSPALEGAPFDVAMNILKMEWQWGEKVTVNGQNITVDIPLYFEGSGDSLPGCQTFKATVNPLPAGKYTLVWRFYTGNYQTVSTSQLTVAKPTRQRAARH
jgi:hypothetical protein